MMWYFDPQLVSISWLQSLILEFWLYKCIIKTHLRSRLYQRLILPWLYISNCLCWTCILVGAYHMWMCIYIFCTWQMLNWLGPLIFASTRYIYKQFAKITIVVLHPRQRCLYVLLLSQFLVRFIGVIILYRQPSESV